jgi:pimeloyl-ACP methyl ester carboxylesterase
MLTIMKEISHMPAKPCIVLVPGWATSKFSYGSTIRYLEHEGYRVLVPPVHFERAATPEDSLEGCIADMRTYIREQQTESFIMIGVSLGGLVTLAYAHRHPEDLSKIVLVGAAGIMPHRPFALWAIKISSMWLRLSLNPRSLTAALWVALDFLRSALCHLPHLVRSGQIARRLDVRKLGLISSVPTALVWGEQDRVIPLTYGKQLHAYLSGSSWRVVPGDHLWVRVEPRFLKDALID